MRVWLPDEEDDAPVVIFSEIPGNEGQSVTNAAEVIAGEVLTQHAFTGTAPVFIEHYSDGARGRPGDPHTFDLVTFAEPLRHKRVWSKPARWIPLLGEPDWRPLTREQVERLVGERVDWEEFRR